MNEETAETRETLNTLVDQKEPQSAMYSLRLIILICVIIVVLLFGMFSFLSNSNLFKDKKENPEIASSAVPESITPTTTSQQPIKARFEIITGDVYRTIPGEQRKLLVSKDELKVEKELNLNVLEIVSYKVSPSMNNIVLMANVGLTPYALFQRNMTTGETTYIERGQDAAWSVDDRYIATRTSKTDIGPYQIVVYDTQTKKMAEVTFSKELDSKNTSFGELLWSADDPDTIVAEFSTYGDYPYNLKDHGTLTIKVK